MSPRPPRYFFSRRRVGVRPGVCPSNGLGRVARVAVSNARRRDGRDTFYRTGAATMQAAPRRRNPMGSRGLRPHSLSLVVGGCLSQPPPRSSTAARKTRLRGPSQYSDTLLGLLANPLSHRRRRRRRACPGLGRNLGGGPGEAGGALRLPLPVERKREGED